MGSNNENNQTLLDSSELRFICVNNQFLVDSQGRFLISYIDSGGHTPSDDLMCQNGVVVG